MRALAQYRTSRISGHEALVHVINKQSCRDKNLMCFVHKLVLVCLQHNILFKAKHIPGTYNRLADLLSRFQIPTFQREAPASMNSFATDIPSVSVTYKLGHVITLLTRSSLQRSSLSTYSCAWKLFDQFYSHVFSTISYNLPLSPNMLALFIAYMYDWH